MRVSACGEQPEHYCKASAPLQERIFHASAALCVALARPLLLLSHRFRLTRCLHSSKLCALWACKAKRASWNPISWNPIRIASLMGARMPVASDDRQERCAENQWTKSGPVVDFMRVRSGVLGQKAWWREAVRIFPVAESTTAMIFVHDYNSYNLKLACERLADLASDGVAEGLEGGGLASAARCP